MARKVSKYYISPKEFKKEILIYQQNDTEQMSDELGTMLLKLAQRYASKPNFCGYSYREEFVSDAIERMIQQIHKIDLNHPNCNPFAYLTQVCKNCFRARINKETKYTETKERLKIELFDKIEDVENIHFKANDDYDDDFV